MTVYWRAFVFVIALLIGSAALAQEPQGYLGVELQDITKEEADRLGWEAPRGAKVVRPVAGGPAPVAGMLPEDIVVFLDGQEVENMRALIAGVSTKTAGAQVRLRVLRAGRERTLTATLARRPAELALPAPANKDLPRLMLDPDGHMAQVKGVVFTRDGRHVVSAGTDKVIRVWDWQTGKTVRSIRGRVGPGPEGSISAMAMSPDGTWLAVGGWMAQGAYGGFGTPDNAVGDVRLYDFATGKLAALLKGHTDAVTGLAFAPDGKRLISTGGVAEIVVWDIERRALEHRLVGHKAEIYAVGVTPDGARVVTGSYDTTLKLWSIKDGREVATLEGHKARVHALAVSPRDGTIASGSIEGEIRLWDGNTGRYLRTVADQGGAVASLVFSPDGTRLLSSCATSGCAVAQRVWEVATSKEIVTYKDHDNVVLATSVSPDGTLAVTAGGNNFAVRIWDLKTGETRKVLAGTGAAVWAVGFSRDGRRAAWGTRAQYVNHNDRGPLAFGLSMPAKGQSIGHPEPINPSRTESVLRAATTHGGYTLSHRKGGAYGWDSAILQVKKNDEVVGLIERGVIDGYQHRAYSFTPDGLSIISGGDGGHLAAYDLTGRPLGNFVGHEGDVWAVTPSSDGRLLISGSADHTIRVWNLNTRELIITLFHGTDGEWVMWTPQGYYTGSPGADRIVGWQIDKGADQAADYVGAEQLRQHLNRPDIVEKAIILASAEQAVREAPGTSFRLSDLLARPVPRYKIATPTAGSTSRAGRATMRIVIEPTPDPVQLIRVQVNGRQVDEQTPEIGSGGFRTGEHSLTVPLAKGRNEVRVLLTNAIGEKAETMTLIHEGDGDLDKRGTLQILAIGVSEYKSLGHTCGGMSCDLRFTTADAVKFADAVEKRLGPSHLQIEKRVLVNGRGPSDAPTAANIFDAVEVLRNARETGTVVLFIAGHGSNESPDYQFLPTNAERSGSGLRGSTVVPWQVLQGAIEAAKGRRLLFVDTCHSGNAYNQRLGNAAYHANIIACTAARFDQEAVEDASLGHGIFTYAVVEGLAGKGELASMRQISTKGLADYIVRRVAALAKELKAEQEPQYFKGRDAEDFVLARW